MEDDMKTRLKNMSDEEYKDFLEKKAIEMTVSVGEFIEYLKKMFNSEDKVCYLDCVEGFKYDLTPLRREDLGKMMFRYVGDDKKRMIKNGDSIEYADSLFRHVGDDYVLVI